MGLNYVIIAVNYFCVLYWFLGVYGLKNVSIEIPMAVAAGTTVNMYCRYDLENDDLYTVKWYKGQEFYRYIPKEMPPIGTFGDVGGKVLVSNRFYETFSTSKDKYVFTLFWCATFFI